MQKADDAPAEDTTKSGVTGQMDGNKGGTGQDSGNDEDTEGTGAAEAQLDYDDLMPVKGLDEVAPLDHRALPPEEAKKEREKVVAYALLGLSMRDMGQLLGVDEGTIRNRYSALVAQKRAQRRLMISKAQVDLLNHGDRTMAVWLGKNVLGQTDRAEVKQTHTLKMYGKEAPVEEV